MMPIRFLFAYLQVIPCFSDNSIVLSNGASLESPKPNVLSVEPSTVAISILTTTFKSFPFALLLAGCSSEPKKESKTCSMEVYGMKASIKSS